MKNNRFFPMPYEIFNLELKGIDIAIYSYLMSCENRKTYTCYPSFNTIGKAVNASINTIQSHVRTLEEKGLIETQHTKIITKKGMKLNGNLKYRILPIKEAVNLYNQTQLNKAMLDNKKYKIEKKFRNSPTCNFYSE